MGNRNHQVRNQLRSQRCQGSGLGLLQLTRRLRKDLKRILSNRWNDHCTVQHENTERSEDGICRRSNLQSRRCRHEGAQESGVVRS